MSSRAEIGAKPRWRTGLVVMVTTSLVLLLLLEVAIRAFVPDNKFLDRNTDCYWITRIQIRAEGPSSKRLTNVAFNERLGWTMRASMVGADGETTNRFGLRGSPDLRLVRTEGVGRVAVLGDSFTFGLGVADDETYSARLEQLVPNLEVLNMGVNGYGTDQQLLYWKLRGRRFRPDVVLIGVYVPDFHRNGLSVREMPKPRFYVRDGNLVPSPQPVPGPREVLTERGPECRSALRIADLARYVVRTLRRREPDGSFDEKAALMTGILRHLHESTRSAGAELAVLVLPEQTYRAFIDHRRIEEVIERAGEELDVPVLNLTEPLMEWQAANPDTPAYGSHGHWTPEGHDVGARLILAFLEERGLLPAPSTPPR